MADDSDNKLKECLQSVISAVQRVINEISNSIESGSNSSNQSTTTILDVNIFQISFNPEEDDLMDQLKMHLEYILHTNVPLLSERHKKYLFYLLYDYTYDYKCGEFLNGFNRGLLKPLLLDLKSMLASIDAFQAAFSGDRAKVQDFVEKYPAYKDKPGPWGTTLLYSAARNDHRTVVEYLIWKAQCNVNACNQQHIVHALSISDDTDDEFTRVPTAASTALHGACFYGRLDIVKLLVQFDADYFAENHAKETPLMNAQSSPHILEFFRKYLVLSYSSNTNDLPNQPISKEARGVISDCVWESKSFSDSKWIPFSFNEVTELHENLLKKSNRPFQQEVHLRTGGGVYSVSMADFRQSGKDRSYHNRPAWVRCRGSSFLNFDCYAIWQIMFISHPTATTQSSLEMLRIPVSYDSRFRVKLNSWYYCNSKTTEQLEKAMDYRRRNISIGIQFMSPDTLMFDLQNFYFENKRKTVAGYIRWIPKLVPNIQRGNPKAAKLSVYGADTTHELVPLTTELQEFINKNGKLHASENLDLDFPYSDPIYYALAQNEVSHSHVNQNDKARKFVERKDLSKELPKRPPRSDPEFVRNRYDNGQWRNLQETESDETSSFASGSTDDEQEKRLDYWVNENVANAREKRQVRVMDESNILIEKRASAAAQQEIVQMRNRIKDLDEDLRAAHLQQQQLKNSAIRESEDHRRNVRQLLQRIEQMDQERNRNLERERALRRISDSIKEWQYQNIQKEVVDDFLSPKQKFIIDHLRTKTPRLERDFSNQVPTMLFDRTSDSYTVTVTGFSEHHDEFRKILQRIWSLLNVTQSAKNFYQRHLKRIIKSITEVTFSKVTPKTNNWNMYSKLIVQLIDEEKVNYQKDFDNHITLQTHRQTNEIIEGNQTSPWVEVRSQTDSFMQKRPFDKVIEVIKELALEKFIMQNITYQQTKMEGSPTSKSIEALEYHIKTIQNDFKNSPKYRGYEVHHFNLIPNLLQRLVIYYCCFKMQLTLYESSKELLDIVDKNAVTTISTSTGSGKSTLLPALLIADGYDKVFVTQPRRLPCQLIANRINSTIDADIGAKVENLAGWEVSGKEHNEKAQVIYLTDGLLKERLLHDENFVTTNTKYKKSIVVFIDEVHERSINIDLCLALLARTLQTKPTLKSKMKVIISSATLDSSVPNLFSRIPQVNLGKFAMPQMGTRFPVRQFPRPNENILTIVQELYQKRQRHDQILCFFSSVSEVNQSCRQIRELSHGAIVAEPLIQSQHPNEQQKSIEHGTVFFSTTVAETSLTFPCLKYVVDSGKINMPVYDVKARNTVLKEVRAAESTIKQRLGRLGRTQPGEYYSVYSFKVDEVKYPEPQICQSDLLNLEFSLRKPLLKKGINYLKEFLPKSPPQEAIDAAIQQLKQLDIIPGSSPNETLTNFGSNLAELPDFGSLPMSKSVLAALDEYHCGRDLIRLSSILGVLNTTSIFEAIPQSLRNSADGDFMTLLKVMDTVLDTKTSVPPPQYKLAQICETKGLGKITHIIKQAVRRYRTVQDVLKQSTNLSERSQVGSGNWENIARALLAGYSDNVFVSMKELKERTHRFIRYSDNSNDMGTLDFQSTLTRDLKDDPVPIVLARDIRRSTAIRGKAILSFIGKLEPSWLQFKITRNISINGKEEHFLRLDDKYAIAQSKFSDNINMNMNKSMIALSGSAGEVLKAELHLRQQMIEEFKFSLTAAAGVDPNLDRNLDSVIRMTHIFNPLKWRWEARNQVEITVNGDTAKKTCDVIVKARDSVNQEVKNEFDSFLGWLRNCAVIRHPNAGVPPRSLHGSIRKNVNCRDIEERIARVTDSNRSPVDVFNGVKGPNVTRETRMEAVAWIAVCKFNCKLEGGFVRDWIVKGQHVPPKNPTSLASWVDFVKNLPYIKKEIVPADLDCHLPSHIVFDIDKFQDELFKLDISCEVFRENWRYVLLLDANASTGPYTMDLIEPHVALTHDRIDFDVSNLSVEKDHTNELGMRIDIEQKPYCITLESIVENIMNSRFRILRPSDPRLQERIDKMEKIRGWTLVDANLSVLPLPPPRHYYIKVPLPSPAVLYQSVASEMSKISGAKIVSIQEIRNPFLEEIYEGMKKIIGRQCKNDDPNEVSLFHGTAKDGITGIPKDGFDDRYFSSTGAWGHGAYFAENPEKSHDYTDPNTTTQHRVMFYSKVLLGKMSIQSTPDSSLASAPVGYHSVKGTAFKHLEFIIYRYGQALPHLEIVYKT